MITIVSGDATKPIGKGKKLICHINNNLGRWGKGFVLAVSKRWPVAREQYLALDEYQLGTVQFVPVTENIIVANMIAQDGINSYDTPFKRRVDYVALDTCLQRVAEYAAGGNYSIHMPRIGTGLGGGKWQEIEEIITKRLEGVEVYVYIF